MISVSSNPSSELPFILPAEEAEERTPYTGAPLFRHHHVVGLQVCLQAGREAIACLLLAGIDWIDGSYQDPRSRRYCKFSTDLGGSGQSPGLIAVDSLTSSIAARIIPLTISCLSFFRKLRALPTTGKEESICRSIIKTSCSST